MRYSKDVCDMKEKLLSDVQASEQDELTIEKEEIYKAIRKNSHLDQAEYHFAVDEGSNKLRFVHFPEECSIDPDLHGDITMIDFKEICKPIDKRERGRILNEYIEFADGDEEDGKTMMKDGNWEDEFMDIPEKIRIDVDQERKLKVLE